MSPNVFLSIAVSTLLLLACDGRESHRLSAVMLTAGGDTLKPLPVEYPALNKPCNRSGRSDEAHLQVADYLNVLFQKRDIPYPPRRLFLRVFKEEDTLEVWAAADTGTYKLVKAYEICAASGGPGPKCRQGDRQVPEGFYYIDRYNPWSSYHLSLGLNYPNRADRIRCGGRNLGGDIFIHGDCVSIGCMAMQDGIKEIYLMAAWACAAGNEQLPVHIFPFRMTPRRLKRAADSEHFAFRQTLQPGYDCFRRNRRLPDVKITDDGRYECSCP